MLRFHCYFTILLALIVGCSGNVALRGTVTFSDDGTPVTAGTVTFRKGDGHIARGRIQEDGTYNVGFEREANGLPPGQYMVAISDARVIVGQHPGSDDLIWEQLIDMRYENPETSGLAVEVNASTRVFDIQVERFRR